MPCTVALVEPADLSSIATIQWSALRDNPLTQTLYPRGLTADLVKFTTASYEKACTYPSVRIIKATDDETGQIVAFAKWVIYKQEEQEDDEMKEAHAAGENLREGKNEGWHSGKASLQSPPHCYTRVLDDWNRRVTSMRTGVMSNKRHSCRSTSKHSLSCYLACYSTKMWVLDILHTHPSQQGKGAGTQLVKWGTDRADKEGIQCYVETPVAGYSLFRQSGFQNVTEMSMDLGKYKDGFVEYKHLVMVRPPFGTTHPERPPPVPPKKSEQRRSNMTEGESVWDTATESDENESPTLQYTAEARMMEMRSSTSTGSPRLGAVPAMRATTSMKDLRSSASLGSQFGSISDMRSSSSMRDPRNSSSTQPGSVRKARASMREMGKVFSSVKIVVIFLHFFRPSFLYFVIFSVALPNSHTAPIRFVRDNADPEIIEGYSFSTGDLRASTSTDPPPA